MTLPLRPAPRPRMAWRWPAPGAGAALAAVIALVAVLSTPAPARAHALLAASSPADGATVDQAPRQVVLTFTEPIDPALSAVRLLDATGAQVDVPPAEAVPGRPLLARVGLGPLAEGAYTLTWRVTSPSDGHTTVGSVAFGVGVPVAAAGQGVAGDRAPTPTPRPVGVAGRWLFYVGVVLLVGAAVVGAGVVADPRSVGRRPLVAAWVAAATGLALTVVDQVAAARTGLGALLASSTGHRVTVQAVAVVATGAALAWAWHRPGRVALAAVGVGAAAAMLARALAGHANASSPRWFTVGAQWAHLVSVGAWVGGLPWLRLALRCGDAGRGAGVARRFSTVAAATLALVVATGVARALDEVGAWGRLAGTGYGLALVAKLALVAVLVALGARSRFRHVGRDGRSTSPALRRVVAAEVAVAAAVLAGAAILTGFPPSKTVAAAARDAAPPAATATGSDFGTTVRVRLIATPGTAGTNQLDATVADYDSGRAVPARRVALRFRLPTRPDLAPATVELSPDGDGRWKASASSLSVAGTWEVTAVVETDGDAVEVPMELDVRAPGPGAVPGQVRPGTCRRSTGDPGYTVSVDTDPAPPRAEGATMVVTLRRDGAPVAGAKVCLKVDMPDMAHPGVSAEAVETAPGRYEAPLKFTMVGPWTGSVVVDEKGRPAVSAEVRFEVR